MQRPASVIVFGILNIVFAAMGLIGTVGSVFMMKIASQTGNPVVALMKESPALAAWTNISIVLGALAAVALLAAGIGLLCSRSWARKLTLIYAWYAIVMGLVAMVANYFLMMRPLLAQATQEHGAAAAGAIGGAAGSVIGGCFGLVYPIVLLFFMTRPAMVAAFETSRTPPGLPPA